MTRRAEGWPAEVTGVIGRAVRKYRDQRGWTGERLITELAEIDVKMTRSALTNLEAGRRESVGVHELFALAAVLGVPPLSMIIPDPATDVAPRPGQQLDGMRAAGWITGSWLPVEVQFGDLDESKQRYWRASEPFDDLRTHDAMAEDVTSIAELRHAADAVGLYDARIRALRQHRADIAAKGWPLPPLPDALHDVGVREEDLDPEPARTENER